MRNLFLKWALAATLVLSALFGCLNDDLGGGGTEIPNEVRGTLYDVAGLPAIGAQVTLLPAGYIPDTTGLVSGTFDVFTDSVGRYAFTNVPDGAYNALFAAAGEGDVAFRDSILVVDGRASAPNDTLRAPGTVTTVIRVRPEDGSRTAFIQVLGTNIFRKGVASDDIELSLPQGTFNVRVSVDIPEVAPVSETVSVVSGASDTLAVSFPTYLYPVLW